MESDWRGGEEVHVMRRYDEARERFTERRRREDESPRLAAEIPSLAELRIEVDERRGDSPFKGTAHIRRIVVEHAPALFVIACGDPACRDGGHDITRDIMRALRAGETRLDGEDECRGQIQSADCRRVMRYVAIAKYRAPED